MKSSIFDVFLFIKVFIEVMLVIIRKMNLKILNSKQRKKIIEYLKEQYGIQDLRLDYVFIQRKDKIYLLSNKLKDFEIGRLYVNSLGVYFLNRDRLSIEGSQIIGKKAKKNVVELDKKQIEKWVRGEDVKAEGDYSGYVLVKYKNDFYGCGSYKDGMIKNFIPKDRRIKT